MKTVYLLHCARCELLWEDYVECVTILRKPSVVDISLQFLCTIQLQVTVSVRKLGIIFLDLIVKLKYEIEIEKKWNKYILNTKALVI